MPLPLPPNARRRQFTTFTSSASASTQKPKQAIQNKPCVSLTRSGFVCVTLLHAALISCPLLCHAMPGKTSLCWPLCLCAGLFVAFRPRACSLVGAGTGLGWLVLIFCERKTLLAGWFGLTETNKRTSCMKLGNEVLSTC